VKSLSILASMAKNRKKKQGGEPQNKQSGAVVGAAGDDWLTPEVLGSMRAKELKQVLGDRGISSDDLEKKDLIDKILTSAREGGIAEFSAQSADSQIIKEIEDIKAAMPWYVGKFGCPRKDAYPQRTLVSDGREIPVPYLHISAAKLCKRSPAKSPEGRHAFQDAFQENLHSFASRDAFKTDEHDDTQEWLYCPDADHPDIVKAGYDVAGACCYEGFLPMGTYEKEEAGEKRKLCFLTAKIHKDGERAMLDLSPEAWAKFGELCVFLYPSFAFICLSFVFLAAFALGPKDRARGYQISTTVEIPAPKDGSGAKGDRAKDGSGATSGGAKDEGTTAPQDIMSRIFEAHGKKRAAKSTSTGTTTTTTTTSTTSTTSASTTTSPIQYELRVTSGVCAHVANNVRNLTWSTKKGDAWLYPKIEAMYGRTDGEARGRFPSVKFWSTELYVVEEGEGEEGEEKQGEGRKQQGSGGGGGAGGAEAGAAGAGESADLEAWQAHAPTLQALGTDASDESLWAAVIAGWGAMGRGERKKALQKMRKKARGAVKVAEQQAGGKRATRGQKVRTCSKCNN
jgi:hypothetical protein